MPDRPGPRGGDPRRQGRLRHRDAGFGQAAGLDFVPLLWENFDLLMRQRSYFRPSIQALMYFIGGGRLQQRAAELAGYDPAPRGSNPVGGLSGHYR